MATMPEDISPEPEPGEENRTIFSFLNFLQPLADLLVRLVVAWAFYTSGLTKTLSTTLFSLAGRDVAIPTSLAPTDTTLFLFQEEYKVPILAPELAAQVGTAAEIILPVFLAFGLLGRLSALGLFVFNIVAVISYEAAQSGIAFYQHVLWGLLLLITIAHGPGKISIDQLFRRGD